MHTITQLELELVIAASSPLTREESDRVGMSVKACIAWTLEALKKPQTKKAPAWFIAMKHRAMKLARSIKAACLNLWP